MWVTKVLCQRIVLAAVREYCEFINKWTNEWMNGWMNIKTDGSPFQYAEIAKNPNFFIKNVVEFSEIDFQF